MCSNSEVLVRICVAAYLVSPFLLLQLALSFLFVPRNFHGPTPSNDIHLPFLLMLSQAYFDRIVTAWIFEALDMRSDIRGAQQDRTFVKSRHLHL